MKSNGAVAEILKYISEQTGDTNKEINVLGEQLQGVIDGIATGGSAAPSSATSNALVYFLAGIITGSVSAMVFISYLIKMDRFGKRKLKRRNS